MTEFVNSVLAAKLNLKYVRFWSVLCRLCVGKEEGSDCVASAIFGILAIEVFL